MPGENTSTVRTAQALPQLSRLSAVRGHQTSAHRRRGRAHLARLPATAANRRNAARHHATINARRDPRRDPQQRTTRRNLTVERGQKAGTLHANILTHAGPVKLLSAGLIHAEPVRTNVRAVAAYISKRSQHPEREAYDGRTYGAWGRMADILVADDMPPIVTGATIERTLTPAAERANAATATTPASTSQATDPRRIPRHCRAPPAAITRCGARRNIIALH